ncbi:MAG: TonB-dependent receptor plug domain-containing protein [Luteitalea sp.]|nr:TonB-dependent receptor plug domain-containing protein [Luteitalea sp.]
MCKHWKRWQKMPVIFFTCFTRRETTGISSDLSLSRHPEDLHSVRHLSIAFLMALVSLGSFATPFLARASAQATFSAMTGTVQDVNGGRLAGVTVVARHLDTGTTRTAVAGADGQFILVGLPVGRYEVRAELAGFKPLVRSGVDLVVGEPAVLALVLEVGGLDEAVTVSSAASPVNTRTSELSYLVSQQTIEQLPLNGRNYTDLALLQPGVNPFPHRDGGSVVAHGLGMSVNGQDPRSNVYLIDGTLQNDFTNGPAGSAAGTALGMESIREFRVETNAYAAEFGRNSGGQIHVVTKSGTNDITGSAYEYHRNDALDARNFFDRDEKPAFRRNQYGTAIGGPLQHNRTFFFVGYEALRERLGRTISTVVPDDNARRGVLPDPATPGRTITVPIDPGVQPYLEAFPVANGPSLGGGLADYTFPFNQTIDQHFAQGRVDYHVGDNHHLFARYTFDDADQQLPTDYPQFPRAFVSRNQFFTGEYRQVTSDRTLNTFRIGFSRTRIGQTVQANLSQPLTPFVPGQSIIGDVDIGGLRRFGPQSSANLGLVQNVFSLQYDLIHTRGRHLLKAGALIERYQDNMVNPTFSLGIFRFANLQTFLANQPLTFIGLMPEGQIDRYWRFTLFGFYAQDEFQVTPHLTVNGGLRYELTTMPKDIHGRDSTIIDLTDQEPTVGQLYQNPTLTNLSPRGGFAWDIGGSGRTSLRGGYGLYFNTNNQQNLIVTVTNPPATPRVIISNPTFPVPPFDRAVGNSIRPVQWDLENPRVHVWNVSLQRALPLEMVATVSYAGSRGEHLLRSSDANVPTPEQLPDGSLFIPPGTPRPNSSFSTIEIKSSDGDSWYRALVIDLRRRWRDGFMLQSSYTLSRSEDTTQASTFFSDATNGTTSAFPEFIPDYNKGRSDFDATHSWVMSATWQLPFARNTGGLARALVDGWQLAGILTMRSGNPLTVFVQQNRSRSLWTPSLGPGIGQDRASYAPGRDASNAVLGRPDQWFDPAAFALQPAGTFGNTGRGDFTGPDLRTLDLSLTKQARLGALGTGARLELRIEAFNVLNHTNFGPPSLTAFAGAADDEAPLPTFGRITSTVTSSRQIQLGVRLVF